MQPVRKERPSMLKILLLLYPVLGTVCACTIVGSQLREACAASVTWHAVTNGSNITVEAIGGGGGGAGGELGGGTNVAGGGGGEYAKSVLAYASELNISHRRGSRVGLVLKSCCVVRETMGRQPPITQLPQYAMAEKVGVGSGSAPAGGTAGTGSTLHDGGAGGTPASHSAFSGGGGAGGPNGVGGQGGPSNTSAAVGGAGGGGGSGGGFYWRCPFRRHREEQGSSTLPALSPSQHLL